MSSVNGELKFERTIPAKPEDVYYAVSTSQGWRDWLVDAAYFRAQPGGSFHLSWDTGWYSSGTVEALEKPGKVTLEWRGKEAPSATKVAIRLESEGEATAFSLVHSGFGEGEAWDASREMAASGWKIGLENLESIFDTGADLRVTRRPMLGVMGNDFNEEIAASISVPVSEGYRLADVVEGMGAEKVGLQGDDVIVEMDGSPVRTWEDIGPILQRKQAGDLVDVVFYRGSEKNGVEMELSGRPIPDTPLDPAAFAQEYRKIAADITNELRGALEGVSEAEAEFTDAEAWSVKENIAHLIVGEEWYLFYLTELIVDSVAQYSGTWENRREQLRAVVRVTPTVEQLVQRLENAFEQTCCLLEEAAQTLGARKGVMWQLGIWWLQLPGAHEREHIEQIKKDLEKIRAAEPEPAAP
ncbi:MAG: SRPBCC domain-containing protein [Anaerolineales bacterium]